MPLRRRRTKSFVGSHDEGNNELLAESAGEPADSLDGQIIVDPAHPEWLERKGGDP